MQLDLSLFTDLLPRLYWVLGLVAVDVLVGIVASLKDKTFDWEKLPGFLSSYGMKILGWLIFEGLAFVPAEFMDMGGISTVVSGAAFVALVGGALGSIFKNAQFLFGSDVLNKIGVASRE